MFPMLRPESRGNFLTLGDALRPAHLFSATASTAFISEISTSTARTPLSNTFARTPCRNTRHHKRTKSTKHELQPTHMLGNCKHGLHLQKLARPESTSSRARRAVLRATTAHKRATQHTPHVASADEDAVRFQQDLVKVLEPLCVLHLGDKLRTGFQNRQSRAHP